MPLRSRTTGHLDDTRFSTPVHFSQCSTGIGTDLVANNIPYPILNIGLNDICYSRWTDCIAVRQLGMGKPSPLFFVQLKQYLATFQYRFAGLLISDCFLQGCPLFLTQLYNICLWSSHSRHPRSFLLYHGMAPLETFISLNLIELVH